MFDNLITYLQKKVPAMPASDIEKILAQLKVRTIKKRKNLLNEGDICHYMYYVNEGLFRYYIFDEKEMKTPSTLLLKTIGLATRKRF